MVRSDLRLLLLASLTVACAEEPAPTAAPDALRAEAGTCEATLAPKGTLHHVRPDGSARAGGTSFDDALDLTSALAKAAPGDVVLLQPGTYAIPYVPNAKNTITLAKSGTAEAPISIVAARCGRAVLDFQFPEKTWVQDSFGFLLKGSYWTFRGIDVTHAGYQGVYVTGAHNTFDNCRFFDNRNSGLEINKGGSYTTVLNSDAFRNYDPKKLGGMADGFASKQTQGPGNHFVGCRAWENSDDGFDTFDSAETVNIEDSWAFDNGLDVWKYGDFAGNGNGFKIGGNYKAASNRVVRSIAFGNRVKGFDQNHNTGSITLLNCLGYANGTNYGLGGELDPGQQNVLRNNVSLGPVGSIAHALTTNNSWNEGFSASADDFVSLDLAQARLPRLPDGRLPAMSLFQLRDGSRLVDRGVDVALPYAGAAPDLGPFERRTAD